MESKKLILDTLVVSYLQGKNRDTINTLLFLHGWMQDKNSFQEIFHILEEKNIPYISIDFPGFGGTSLTNENMEVEDYGIFLIQVIEKLGLKKPILVGHSFGGRICIYLGSFYENIEKIVLIGAAGIAPKDNPMRLIVVKTGKIFFSIPGLKKIGQKIKSKISATDYKTAGKMTQIYRNTISNDLQKYMMQIPYPTLMIWGEDDDQVSVDEGQIMHGLIKNSQLHILKGGHFIHQEKPENVTEILYDFIKK